MRPVSDELFAAVADAQQAAQKAHNLAYRENAPLMLKLALGRAQNVLIRWQVRLANRDAVPSLPGEPDEPY